MGKKISILVMLLVLGLGLNAFAQTTGISGDGQINKCETKSYSISIENNSGNPLTNLVITNDISLLVGFSYVPAQLLLTSMAVLPFVLLIPVEPQQI